MDNQEALLKQFHEEGFLVLPGLLPCEDVAALRAGFEAAFAEPCAEARLYNMEDMFRPKMFERNEAAQRLLEAPQVIDLIEAIVGPTCHVIANNALRTGPGQGVSGWHVDEDVRLPIPDGVELDERIAMPCWIVNMMCYLCDMDEELGPTELVPGSHRAGRSPRPEDNDGSGNPTYKGRSAVKVLGPAGTCALWNDQTWHRGSVNTSNNRMRFAQAVSYGKRWVAPRFYPFVGYAPPAAVMERATARGRRLLGAHERGAYG